MWVGTLTLEDVNYIIWAREYPFTIRTFKVNLEFWVEFYPRHSAQEFLFIPRIHVGNIVHPNITPLNYYS